MMTLTTGPVDRGVDTERVIVLVANHDRRPVTVTVVLRRDGAKFSRRCTCSCQCHCGHRSRTREERVVRRRRRIRPGHTASFDADLGPASRFEVRVLSPSRRILVYVAGYRPDRWWPWRIHDPSTTFRPGDMIRMEKECFRNR